MAQPNLANCIFTIMRVLLLQVAHYFTARLDAETVRNCGSCKQGVPVALLPNGTEIEVVQKEWNRKAYKVSSQCYTTSMPHRSKRRHSTP